MNVAELIRELKKCEPHAEVTVHNRGFFTGTRQINKVSQYNVGGSPQKEVHLS